MENECMKVWPRVDDEGFPFLLTDSPETHGVAILSVDGWSSGPWRENLQSSREASFTECARLLQRLRGGIATAGDFDTREFQGFTVMVGNVNERGEDAFPWIDVDGVECD